MSSFDLPVTESCLHCPHFDTFQGSCTHDHRQSVIQVLASKEGDRCPLYPAVHAEAMQELEKQELI